MTFLVFIMLVNNITIPCLSVALVSPNCFSTLLHDAPPVVSSYVVEQCVVYNHFVDKSHCSASVRNTHYITYVPQFVYSYQCSSAFTANYTSIYMYMFIILCFIRPFYITAIQYVHQTINTDSIAHRIIDRLLPMKFKPLDRDFIVTDKLHLFSRESFVVKINNYIAILITFGALCPPLAAVICLAIFSFTYYEQLVVGKLMKEAKDGNLLIYQSILDNDLNGVATHFSHTIWLIVPFASLFYAYYVFDTLGDAVNWNNAYWAVIVILCVPVLCYVGVEYKLYIRMRHVIATFIWPNVSVLCARCHRTFCNHWCRVNPNNNNKNNVMENPLHRGSLARRSTIVTRRASDHTDASELGEEEEAYKSSHPDLTGTAPAETAKKRRETEDNML